MMTCVQYRCLEIGQRLQVNDDMCAIQVSCNIGQRIQQETAQSKQKNGSSRYCIFCFVIVRSVHDNKC